MNEYDSDKIADLMQTEEDFVLVDNEKKMQNLLVLNTCSIRRKSTRKSFVKLARWRKRKDVKPDIKIAIGGCRASSQEGENGIKRGTSSQILFLDLKHFIR